MVTVSIVLLLCLTTATLYQGVRTKRDDLLNGIEIPEVQFMTENNTVITAYKEDTVTLHCDVVKTDEQTAAWIRTKFGHVLTFGEMTITTNYRYSAVHVQGSQNWGLKIQFLRQSDAGIYQCQVSSDPPSNIFVELVVIDPHAQISGPSDKETF